VKLSIRLHIVTSASFIWLSPSSTRVPSSFFSPSTAWRVRFAFSLLARLLIPSVSLAMNLKSSGFSDFQVAHDIVSHYLDAFEILSHLFGGCLESRVSTVFAGSTISALRSCASRCCLSRASANGSLTDGAPEHSPGTGRVGREREQANGCPKAYRITVGSVRWFSIPISFLCAGSV